MPLTAEFFQRHVGAFKNRDMRLKAHLKEMSNLEGVSMKGMFIQIHLVGADLQVIARVCHHSALIILL